MDKADQGPDSVPVAASGLSAAQTAAFVEQALDWLRSHQTLVGTTADVVSALENPATVKAMLAMLPANTAGLSTALAQSQQTLAGDVKMLAANPTLAADLSSLLTRLLALFH